MGKALKITLYEVSDWIKPVHNCCYGNGRLQSLEGCLYCCPFR